MKNLLSHFTYGLLFLSMAQSPRDAVITKPTHISRIYKNVVQTYSPRPKVILNILSEFCLAEIILPRPSFEFCLHYTVTPQFSKIGPFKLTKNDENENYEVF